MTGRSGGYDFWWIPVSILKSGYCLDTPPNLHENINIKPYQFTSLHIILRCICICGSIRSIACILTNVCIRKKVTKHQDQSGFVIDITLRTTRNGNFPNIGILIIEILWDCLCNVLFATKEEDFTETFLRVWPRSVILKSDWNWAQSHSERYYWTWIIFIVRRLPLNSP